jgi:hypothetical protein
VCIFIGAGCQKGLTEKVVRDLPEKQLSDKVFLTAGGQPLRVPEIRLSRDTVYVVTEPFRRLPGETLEIEAGTLIKVSPGVGIVIDPGARLDAVGTSSLPIVFTSNLPRASRRASWNGITLRGNAPSNTSSAPGQSGDASGSLSHVRIEFGPLTLERVGSGTRIENIQVSYSGARSSFVFDGGTVDARRLVSYACGGPADVYFTNGYRGRVQFALAYRHPFFGQTGTAPAGSLTGLHIENSTRGDVQATPFTEPLISNLTIIGPDLQPGVPAAFADTSGAFNSAAIVTDGNAYFQLRHSLVLGYPSSAWILGDSLSAANLNFGRATHTHSIFQCANNYRSFYIIPGLYVSYGPGDFQEFVLRSPFRNRLVADIGAIGLADPFNYVSPKPWPAAGSMVFGGTDFSGPVFSNGFFSPVDFIGALGAESWLSGWTNFTPLKTSYNEPQ